MKKSRRGKARTLSQFRQRMRSMRLIAHLPQRCDDTNVRVRARADPEQFSERLPPVANGNAAFAKAGQNLDYGGLVDQAEPGAMREVQHPRAQRGKIAAERIDIEERHRSAGDTKVMQGVRRNEDTARATVCRIGGGRIVGNLQLP